MSDHWDSSFSTRGELTASVFVGPGLSECASLSAHPWLLVVRLPIRKPRPDRLSAAAEKSLSPTTRRPVLMRPGKASRITAWGRRFLTNRTGKHTSNYCSPMNSRLRQFRWDSVADVWSMGNLLTVHTVFSSTVGTHLPAQRMIAITIPLYRLARQPGGNLRWLRDPDSANA